MGFVPGHISVSRILEKSLQSVDPSVVWPYWEYTIDVEDILANHNGMLLPPTGAPYQQCHGRALKFYAKHHRCPCARGMHTPTRAKCNTTRPLSIAGNFWKWRDLPLFSDDWFGKSDEKTGFMSAGTVFAEIDLTRNEYTVHTNSYGLIRAPWNNLNVSRVARFIGAGSAFGKSTHPVAMSTSTRRFPAKSPHAQRAPPCPTCRLTFRPASTHWRQQLTTDRRAKSPYRRGACDRRG